ncbi:hypothetical protein SAMN02910356_00023 [Selenomonas sp. GACV-9]|nr:hypothetical protein SAMN02910356_00023 [Selenomonas ruminantium]
MNIKRMAFVLLALLLLLTSVAAAAPAAKNPPTLSVDGEGTGIAAPDRATVTIVVTTQATDAGKAQNDNAWTTEQVNKAIKALGIEAKDIQTNNYSFRPNYRTAENHRNEISGYTVNNSIIVIVRDINKTGKVIDAALGAGANQIHSLDFTASNTQAVRKEALMKAVQDARDKADVLAKGLGKRIVGIQNVSESTGYLESRRYDNAMLVAAKSAAATTIEPGSLSLTARVHIDYILEN